MSVDHRHAASHFERLLRERNADQYLDRLAPKPGEAAASFPAGARLSTDVLEHRWEFLAASPENKAALLDPQTLAQLDRYGNNIENFVGTVKVPVGIAGPLRVNGLFAQGDYLVPLATTEAALVASYHRGAQLLTAAGGCTSVLLSEGVHKRGLSLERFAQLTSTAAAKMFGLYPRKGAIAVGSDADLVIYDPKAEHVISAKTHHMNVDYSCYEGRRVRGRSDVVLSRGEIVVRNGQFHGRPGRGQFLKREAADYTRLS